MHPYSKSVTWLKCKCGYVEIGVCVIFFGWTCPACGQKETATIRSRRVKPNGKVSPTPLESSSGWDRIDGA